MNEKKDMKIELLRVLSCILVIIIHVVSKNFFNTNINTLNWNYLNIFDSLSRCSVPIFFMISGSFLLKKDINKKTLFKKYIKKYLLIFIIWKLLYGFYYWSSSHTLTLKTLLSLLLYSFKNLGHLWYLVSLLIIYLLYPYIKIIIKKLNSKTWRYTNIIFLTIIIIYSIYIINIKEIPETVKNIELFGYIIYFILGYYIYNIKKKDNKTLKYLLISILSIIITIILTKNSTLYYNNPIEKYYSYFFITTYIESIMIFNLFINSNIINNISNKLKKIINILSKNTLNIYNSRIYNRCNICFN